MATVDCFLLTDAAQVVGGKLYILGGGWARLTAPTLPLTRAFELAVRVVVPWMETNQAIRLELHLEDADGASLLSSPVTAEVRVGRPVTLPEGSDQPVPLVLRLQSVTFAHPGRYVLTLRHGDEILARSAFELAIGPPSPRPV